MLAKHSKEQFTPNTITDIENKQHKTAIETDTNITTTLSREELITTGLLAQQLKYMRTKKAYDEKDIPGFSLKHIPLKAIALITNIMNKITALAHIPAQWKQTTIIPIKKETQEQHNELPSYLSHTNTKQDIRKMPSQ